MVTIVENEESFEVTANQCQMFYPKRETVKVYRTPYGNFMEKKFRNQFRVRDSKDKTTYMLVGLVVKDSEMPYRDLYSWDEEIGEQLGEDETEEVETSFQNYVNEDLDTRDGIYYIGMTDKDDLVSYKIFHQNEVREWGHFAVNYDNNRTYWEVLEIEPISSSSMFVITKKGSIFRLDYQTTLVELLFIEPSKIIIEDLGVLIKSKLGLPKPEELVRYGMEGRIFMGWLSRTLTLDKVFPIEEIIQYRT